MRVAVAARRCKHGCSRWRPVDPKPTGSHAALTDVTVSVAAHGDLQHVVGNLDGLSPPAATGAS